MRNRRIVIIPMKENNVRLPGKNVKMLGGKPLYHHMTDMLQSIEVDLIIFDLQGESLVEQVNKDIAYQGWDRITISRRPSEYCDPMIGGNELLSRFRLEWKPDDVIAQMHVTSPFLKGSTVQSAFIDLESDRRYMSYASVTEEYQRAWMSDKDTDHMDAVNHDPEGPTLRTQDLQPVLMENGAFFMFKGEYFDKYDRRNGPDSRPRPISFPETIDIDTRANFIQAELYLEYVKREENARKDSESS